MVVAFKPLVYRFIDCTNYHAGLLHFEVKEAVICVFVITAITNFFRFFPLVSCLLGVHPLFAGSIDLSFTYCFHVFRFTGLISRYMS